MKKLFILLLLAAFVFSAAAPSFAANPAEAKAKIAKLQGEVSKLQGTLAKTKNKVQRARLQNTIAGHRKVISELQRELSAAQPSAPAAKPVQVQVSQPEVSQPKILAVKGGLAGGAGLIGIDLMMPVGPMYLGAEAGYAIGNNFGIIDAGVKGVFDFGGPFVGLEVSYGGYSKDVTNVPGLSGVIKSGVGVGLIGGMAIGPMQFSAGYNTILGARADAGYRLYI